MSPTPDRGQIQQRPRLKFQVMSRALILKGHIVSYDKERDFWRLIGLKIYNSPNVGKDFKSHTLSKSHTDTRPLDDERTISQLSQRIIMIGELRKFFDESLQADSVEF